MEEKLSGAEEAEYWRLQEAVTRIENAIYFAGGSDLHAMGMLRQFVQNAKHQMAKIETEGLHKAEKEKDAAALQLEVTMMVEREKALSEPEKEEYAAFLSKDFFTRSDFGQLEHFYSRSWDKLTDDGKGQMSHRVWEGVRRGEYQFNELPDVVKEKEAQQVELLLHKPKIMQGDVGAIPENDKADFLQARENGERQQSYLILNRPSFAERVATTPAHDTVARNAVIDASKVLQAEAQRKAPATVEVAATASMGSTKIELQDLPGIDSVAGSLPPPLPESPGATSGKGHRK